MSERGGHNPEREIPSPEEQHRPEAEPETPISSPASGAEAPQGSLDSEQFDRAARERRRAELLSRISEYEARTQQLGSDDTYRRILEQELFDLRRELADLDASVGIGRETSAETTAERESRAWRNAGAAETTSAAVEQTNERLRQRVGRRGFLKRSLLAATAIGLGSLVADRALAQAVEHLTTSRQSSVEPMKSRPYEEREGFKTEGIPDYELFRRFAAMEEETLKDLYAAGEEQFRTMVESGVKPRIIVEQARENAAIARAIDAKHGEHWRPGEFLDAHRAFSEADQAVLAKKARELRRIYEQTVKEHGIDSKEARFWLKRMDPWAYLEVLSQGGMPLSFTQVETDLRELD